MESQLAYQSFNSNKSLKELLYAMNTNALRLHDLKFEFQFFIALLYKPIFKPRIANLYEALARYKYNLGILEEKRLKLENNVHGLLGQINNGMESKVTAFDDEFVNNYDSLEIETFNFYLKVSDFKLGFFEYIQSVSLN